MLDQNVKNGLYAIAFVAAVFIAIYALFSALVESGMSRFILVNDSDKSVTYTILHDDGDSVNNKSLTKPLSVNPYDESKVSEYGGTYCLYLLDGERSVASYALIDGVTSPQSVRSGIPVYFISKLSGSCTFDFNFPFDRS